MPNARSAFELIETILPICRSITGPGVRETFKHLQRYLPLEISEVPSGTPAFDWEVPPEWTVREAYIADSTGRHVVDFASNNLHLVSYSIPVRRRMTLKALRPHLHTLPDHPEWIPHRTSYYAKNWGFCMAHRQLQALPEDEYEVVIDSELAPGSLTYAECVIPGNTAEEFILFTHTCHPSLCNDNASGIALLTAFGVALRGRRPQLTFRLVFAPSTIGSIVWLARNESTIPKVRAGLVVSSVADSAALTYKRSRRATAEIDFIAAGAVRALDPRSRVIDFSPAGYDERQFCSPGFDLPVGRLTRSMERGYPEYHTSADDLKLVRMESLAESFLALARIAESVDANRRFVSLNPKCEPRLGKRGLFGEVGGNVRRSERERAALWLLGWADGLHGIRDIAAVTGIAVHVLEQAAQTLVEAGLLHERDAEAHLSPVSSATQ